MSILKLKESPSKCTGPAVRDKLPCEDSLAAGIGAVFYARGDHKTKEVQYLSASWDYSYRDVEEIARASDRIALVSVGNVENTFIDQSVPYAIFSVKVETPVYNCEEDQEFSIYMTGAETDTKIMEIAGDPLLQPGDEILVFCKENPDGTYRILGGPQGRLVYDDGTLNSISVVLAQEGEEGMLSGLIVENADARALIREIQGYVGAS